MLAYNFRTQKTRSSSSAWEEKCIELLPQNIKRKKKGKKKRRKKKNE